MAGYMYVYSVLFFAKTCNSAVIMGAVLAIRNFGRLACAISGMLFSNTPRVFFVAQIQLKSW